MITGNFNQADFKVVLPKFEPYTKFATSKGQNVFDKAYSNIKHGFKSTLSH